jgi:hypothetical protein
VIDLFHSLFSQRVRDGETRGIEEYLAIAWPHLDWSAVVQRWEDVFGTDHVEKIAFEELQGPDLPAAFARRVFPDATGFETLKVSPFSNRRLAPRLLEIIRRIYETDLSEEFKRTLTDEVVNVGNLEEEFLTRRYSLTESQIESLRLHCVSPRPTP